MTDSTDTPTAEIVNLADVRYARIVSQIAAWQWEPPAPSEWQQQLPMLTRIAYRAATVGRIGDAGEYAADFVDVVDMIRDAAEQFRFIAAVCEAGADRLLSSTRRR